MQARGAAAHGSAHDGTGSLQEDSAAALDGIELQSLILVRHFELLRRRSDTYAELDRAAYLMLRTLESSGPTSIGGLAATLGLDRSTAGRQVTAMAEHGLVKTAASPADRRHSIVSSTPRGQRLMNGVREQRLAATTDLLSDWNAADLQTLCDMFTRYNTVVAEKFLR